ncbi:hypothetical protein NBRC116595_31590 [Aliiglaciecola sp. NS0011-25]
MILILSVVYSLNNQKDSILTKNLCYLEAQSCRIELDDSIMQVSFSDFPIQIEEMLNLSIIYDTHYVVRRGWLEGTNMYMGKTPLFLKTSRIDKLNNQVNLDAELFIGACSESNMRWKLTIELEDIQTTDLKTVSVFFQTHA